jgi:hypothetical protein
MNENESHDDSGEFFENKAKITEFNKKICVNFSVMAIEIKYRYMKSDNCSFRGFLFHTFITTHDWDIAF